MFCPNCGLSNHTDQRYCRTCGLRLGKVAESLVDQLPSAESAKRLRQDRRLEKFGEFAWNSFALTILAAVGALIYHVVTGVKVWFEGFVGAIVVFAFLGLLHRVIGERAEARRNSGLADDVSSEFIPAEVHRIEPTRPLAVEPETKKLVH